MLPFLKKHTKKEPVVTIPMSEHTNSVHFSIFITLAMLLKQNKFTVTHGEYEAYPHQPTIPAQDYYRVKFPNGGTLYEITREQIEYDNFRIIINTPTKQISFNPSRPFTYAKPLYELTSNAELSPETIEALEQWSTDGQPLHYLASLLAKQK